MSAIDHFAIDHFAGILVAFAILTGIAYHAAVHIIGRK